MPGAEHYIAQQPIAETQKHPQPVQTNADFPKLQIGNSTVTAIDE